MFRLWLPVNCSLELGTGIWYMGGNLSLKSESLQKATIVRKKVIICIKKTQPASFKHHNTGTTKLSSHTNYLHLSTEFY